MKLNLTVVAVASVMVMTQLSCQARGGGHHSGHSGGHSAPQVNSTPPPPPAKPTGSAGNYRGRRGLGRVGRRMGGTGDLDQTTSNDTKPTMQPVVVDPNLPRSAFVKTYSWGSSK